MTQAACEIVTCTIRTKLTKLPKTHAACGVHRLQHYWHHWLAGTHSQLDERSHDWPAVLQSQVPCETP